MHPENRVDPSTRLVELPLLDQSLSHIERRLMRRFRSVGLVSRNLQQPLQNESRDDLAHFQFATAQRPGDRLHVTAAVHPAYHLPLLRRQVERPALGRTRRQFGYGAGTLDRRQH